MEISRHAARPTPLLLDTGQAHGLKLRVQPVYREWSGWVWIENMYSLDWFGLHPLLFGQSGLVAELIHVWIGLGLVWITNYSQV